MDNRIAEKSEWDDELLQLELSELSDFSFDDFDVEFEDIEKEARANGSKDLSDKDVTKFEVIIECEDETHQEELFNRFSVEGLICRVLTL